MSYSTPEPASIMASALPAVSSSAAASAGLIQEFPPAKLYQLPEIPVPQFITPAADYREGVPIVLDLGTSQTRAGFASDITPRFQFPTQIARYRDRKILRTFTLIGSDANYDANTRQAAKSPFDGALVANWEYLETILDYTFVKMGVSSQGQVDNPVIMNEILATPLAQHKHMQELLFETYSVPSATLGIDALFSYHYNNGNTGLVVSAGNETTHIIPVVNGRGILNQAKRLNWGGHQASSFLLSLMQLKYPHTPAKISPWQAEMLMREHCYTAPVSYADEVEHYLDRDEGFDERNHIIQAPFTEVIAPVKTEEELAKIAERRKESGRKLQEQAAKIRLEKLMQKEQDLEYYRSIESKSDQVSQKEFKRLLDAEGIRDENELSKMIKNMDKSIKRSRKQDVGNGDEESDTEEMTFPLLEIPDDQLDPDQIKQKRHQRLLKSNYDARMRAKAEKKREREKKEEEERKDEEWRERDLEGWIKDRREQRAQIMARMKEKQKLKEDLNNRKSLASQLRMKSIANLASEGPSGATTPTNSGGARKRRREDGEDDGFGVDDNDWAVYRDIANASDTEEDDEMAESIRKIEEQLNAFDPKFSLDSSLEAQSNWMNSLVHAFLRGSRPFDPASRAEAHQIHLNVERIRVPEVLFQPSIAGIDQAGLVELASDILLRRLSKQDSVSACKDVFLTGGFSLLRGFDDRLRHELRATLPVDVELGIRRAEDAVLDAWKGMRKWVNEKDNLKNNMLTREEYMEYGPEYIKEHNMGNRALT
ncbi:hypothetical protein BZA70DRAFT_4425 [Myxozyma melibiosi]|uniref:Uncharacterized protein n=1 Tax=Myxozyma melibiosi TaxID=54550 RepID=A0ABR1FDH7_9ASCO